VGGIMGFLELDRRLGEIQENDELYDENTLLLAEALCALAEEIYRLRVGDKEK